MQYNYDEIGSRWIAIWNEPDEGKREAEVSKIWTKDAKHFAPGFEANGLEAIGARADAVYGRFIKQLGCDIRSVNCAGYGDVLQILWEIVPTKGGPAVATGSEVLILNAAGKARLDYQFNDPQS
jgi:hypothetical protein